MSKIKKKPIAIAVLIIITLLFNVYTILNCNNIPVDVSAVFSFEFMSDSEMDVQVFYSDNDVFSEENSNVFSYMNINSKQVIETSLPSDVKYIRIDFGDAASSSAVSAAALSAAYIKYPIDNNNLLDPFFANNVKELFEQNGVVCINTKNGDPYIGFYLGSRVAELIDDVEAVMHRKNLVTSVLGCFFLDIAVIFLLININTVFSVGGYIYREKSMFWILMKNDLQAKFAGSYFGIFWAFVQPVIMMALYWFVFQVGLRAGNVSEYPFILFLMTGLIPWMYFSEALGSSTGVLSEYSYLVKKVIFNVEILPVIKVASSIFVHMFFVSVIVIMCAAYGYTPDLYTLQLVYYIICLAFITMGLSYIVSAVTAFFKDMSQIVSIMLTIGVWLTPIMWNPEGVLSSKMAMLFRINPIYYIVDGFRDSLLNKVWFWEKTGWTCYFWIFAIVIYVVGNKIFNKLKIHFADVL